MEVVVKKKLEKKDAQLPKEELEAEVKAVLKNAEEIVRRTGGRVFFKKKEEGLYNVLDYEGDAWQVRDAVRDEIMRVMMKKVRGQKVKEVELDASELDWNKIDAVVQKIEEKERAKKEQEERVKKTKEKINSLVARFNSEHEEIEAEQFPS